MGKKAVAKKVVKPEKVSNKFKEHVVKSEKTSPKDMRNRYDTVTVKCEFCCQAFNTSKGYHDHANQVHPEQVQATWPSCKKCDVRLPSALALTFHNAKAHSKADLRDSSGT